MQGHGWQFQKKVTVPAGGSVSVPFPSSRPALQQLTCWAISGRRVITNMTFQPRINLQNGPFAATSVVGAIAATIILAMNGATRDQVILPAPPNATTLPVDPFDIDINITNAGAAAEDITIFATAIGRDGGSR